MYAAAVQRGRAALHLGAHRDPNAEGCEVVMRLSREFRPTVKGKVGWALNRLAGTWMWRSYLRHVLAEAEMRGIREEPGT